MGLDGRLVVDRGFYGALDTLKIDFPGGMAKALNAPVQLVERDRIGRLGMDGLSSEDEYDGLRNLIEVEGFVGGWLPRVGASINFCGHDDGSSMTDNPRVLKAFRGSVKH